MEIDLSITGNDTSFKVEYCARSHTVEVLKPEGLELEGLYTIGGGTLHDALADEAYSIWDCEGGKDMENQAWAEHRQDSYEDR